MKFSERIGKQPVRTKLERNNLSIELRNTLWTLILELIINKKANYKKPNEEYSELSIYFRALWIHFFKLPIDNLIVHSGNVYLEGVLPKVRDWFFKAPWYNVFDFIEFSARFEITFRDVCNKYLKVEYSAYRFIQDKLVEINSEEEIQEVEYAIINTEPFNSVKTHLKTALNLLADRSKPDYRNSIKESISAVESFCKIIIKDDKSTLGQALKEIETKHKIPNSLKTAFSALYGYTSEEGGIRHGLLEINNVIDVEEARFMLIACSAFVNYLMCKI